MNCWRVQNLVAPFLDGELPEAECEAIGAHLEACPACLELVESLESLPPVPRPRVDAAVEERLFEAFDARLAQRIATGLPVDEPAAAPRRSLASFVRGEIRVPFALAAGTLAAMVVLGGFIALDHQRVQELQETVARREAVIEALQERVSLAQQEPVDRFEDVLPAANTAPVFLPATAPTATGSTLPFGRSSFPPGAIRQASYDVPRVVR